MLTPICEPLVVKIVLSGDAILKSPDSSEESIHRSSFFNIKIATYTYDPITLALVRVFFASIPLIILCKIKKIKIEAFSKDWTSYSLIGLCNIAIPFTLIAIGTGQINSYLAAMLMSTTPLSGTILAHFFIKDGKINLMKLIGILTGFFRNIIFIFR